MKITNLLFLLLLLVVKESTCQISYQEILTRISDEAKEKLSSGCQRDVSRTTFLTPWFWLMVDSSSTIPSGIAKGNFAAMGNYDECLAINEDQIQTKFCKGTLNLNFGQQGLTPSIKRISTEVAGVPQQSELALGVDLYYCVFKSCSAEDLNIIFNNLIHFEDQQCSSKDPKELDALAITAIVIFGIFALITITSTIYDFYLVYSHNDALHPITLAFSLYSNGKKLFHLGNSQQLSCLNGIKSLSMLWVVLGHVYMAYVFVPMDNYIDVYDWLNSAHSQYISGATVSVDSFLVIGGFLTVYTFQTTMDKGHKFNVPSYYFHRYLRLTPALAAMLLAHVALFNYFGSGPVWQNTDVYLVRGCKKYWWSTLLYLQNYDNPNGTCIPQSWYLSVDMQLFLVSPLILVLIRQWPFWGYATLSILSLLSIIASFLIGYFLKLNGQMSANISGNLTDFLSYYYMPTHTRMVPYLFGIMLGYFIYKIKTSGRKLSLNIVLVILGWVLSLALLATCIYSGHNLQFTEYDRLGNSFFLALIRPVWALALCWVIFACVMDYGGPVNYFLSLSIFQILSRFCYSIYLVHYSFIFLTNFSTRTPLHFSDYNAVHKFWGDFAFSFLIAVLWTLVFESPVIVLEKLLVRGGAESRKEKIPV